MRLLVVLLWLAVSLGAQPGATPRTLQVPPGAEAAPGFNVETATRAYLVFSERINVISPTKFFAIIGLVCALAACVPKDTASNKKALATEVSELVLSGGAYESMVDAAADQAILVFAANELSPWHTAAVSRLREARRDNISLVVIPYADNSDTFSNVWKLRAIRLLRGAGAWYRLETDRSESRSESRRTWHGTCRKAPYA